ncbi:MAG: hypothetical protein JWR88_1515 [Pseudonocardia sp.]|jgi:uncharacterized protein (TIGR03085 family)|nr:hypothetical protein [Pseudonocardia sp.]
MSLASEERRELCDLLDDIGPDAPTLCEGWTTRDLTSHLLARERKPWAAPGIVVPQLDALMRRAMRGYDDQPWPALVQKLRSGPPTWSIYNVPKLDRMLNGNEYFVHHEDVRRGGPDWEPRPPHPKRDDAVWRSLGASARVLYRNSPVGVVLRRPDGAELVARRGDRSVTIVGEPAELMLHAYGRSAIRVELEGDPADVSTLSGTSRRF